MKGDLVMEEGWQGWGWQRSVLVWAILGAFTSACGGSAGDVGESPSDLAEQRPNILFISIDDLNDWIEPLGGHPQTQTPNLARLAEEGVVFTRAYTPSPSCNPARTAIMTGLQPSTTGVYSNYQYWREAVPDAVTLSQHFQANGYWAAGAGKIFHNGQPDPASWDEYFPSLEQPMPDDPDPEGGAPASMPRFEDMYNAFDWAGLDVPDSEMGDYQSVDWVIQQLERSHEQPFFLAAGIYRPHLPWYVPQEYFDLFPLGEVEMPEILPDDLSDVPLRGREIAHRAGNYDRHVREAGLQREAVQGYLASIAFADAMLGRLLDALARSPHADNTVVVVWSDHGWGFGQKEHWRKFALWENSARVVLMFRIPEGTPGLPGGTAAGSRSDRTVSLIDLYPTLVELAGLSPRSDLDGRSLVPLLEEPLRAWPYPALTTYEWGEYAVRDEGFRYIRYIDGTEELYHHQQDPMEWTNLAMDADMEEVKERLASWIPESPVPLAQSDYPLMPHHIPPLFSLEDYLERRRLDLPR